jgi:hypothetical protein
VIFGPRPGFKEGACSAADLLHGVTVQEARMHVSGDGVIFDEIELLAQTVE